MEVSNEDIIRLHSQGLNDREIAGRLQVVKSTISVHRRKLGLGSNNIKRRKNLEKKIVALYDKGLLDPEISEVLDISTNIVWYLRKKLKLKTKYQPQKASDEEIILLHTQGLNDIEISKRVGLSSSKVCRRRQKLGLKSYKEKVSDEDILPLYYKKMLDKEIAPLLGVCAGTIGYRRRKIGLKDNHKIYDEAERKRRRREGNKRFSKTVKGKLLICKMNSKRRGLNYNNIVINDYVEEHILHHDTNRFCFYVPKKEHEKCYYNTREEHRRRCRENPIIGKIIEEGYANYQKLDAFITEVKK